VGYSNLSLSDLLLNRPALAGINLEFQIILILNSMPLPEGLKISKNEGLKKGT
jgi:hypothetical protein